MTATSPYAEYTYVDHTSLHHHAYLMESLLQLLHQTAKTVQSPLRILDLGCGNGSLSKRIAQAGYNVVGVENSTSGMQFTQSNLPNCRFIQANIYDLPTQEFAGEFDVVMAVEVIEHLQYPRILLKTAKQCLKPEGRVIVTTPYHGYWKHLAIALSGKTDQHFNPLWDAGHVKFFSVSTLTQLLHQEGFCDLQFKFAGRFPRLWKSMVCAASVSSVNE